MYGWSCHFISFQVRACVLTLRSEALCNLTPLLLLLLTPASSPLTSQPSAPSVPPVVTMLFLNQVGHTACFVPLRLLPPLWNAVHPDSHTACSLISFRSSAQMFSYSPWRFFLTTLSKMSAPSPLSIPLPCFVIFHLSTYYSLIYDIRYLFHLFIV